MSSVGPTAIRPVEMPASAERPHAARGAGGNDFGAALSDAIAQARASEETATKAAEGFAAGDPSVGIHEVVIASEKANISLRYATTLKNKLVDAYRELMNTQV
jgi:flagellar hook-basal body complex protein FliE